MKRIRSVLLAISILFGCTVIHNVQAQDSSDTLVFVGERLSVETLPNPCISATGELTCINMDAHFKARYRIVQPLVGAHASESLEFRVADHYGFPRFAYFSHALLFVAMGDTPRLHKYQAIPVHRTDDGQWASCGDIRFDPDGPPSSQLKPLRFPDPIARESDVSEIMRVSYANGGMPHWRIEGGDIRCSEGILLEDVYDMVRSGVMRSRGVVLPELGR